MPCKTNSMTNTASPPDLICERIVFIFVAASPVFFRVGFGFVQVHFGVNFRDTDGPVAQHGSGGVDVGFRTDRRTGRVPELVRTPFRNQGCAILLTLPIFFADRGQDRLVIRGRGIKFTGDAFRTPFGSRCLRRWNLRFTGNSQRNTQLLNPLTGRKTVRLIRPVEIRLEVTIQPNFYFQIG
jgi:hypothetical protein